MAEKVRVATDVFTTMHKVLALRKKDKAAGELAFCKNLFKTECEDIRQVLLAINRHAVDFTASCQREPDDRANETNTQASSSSSHKLHVRIFFAGHRHGHFPLLAAFPFGLG